jgi:hypothetical protein
MVSVAEPCSCGSGLAFSLCHGDPRNDFARAQALREAESIGAFFPAVRVRGAAAEAVATGATEDEAVGLVEADEWRRVVDSWAEPYADRWESLTTAAGDVAAAERALVTGALRAAVDEAAPTPPELVAPFEDGALSGSPFAALSLVLPPMSVWSIAEALAAVAAARGRRRARDRDAAIEEVAYALVSFEHVRRVRSLAAGLASELPLDGLPRASQLLDDVCRSIELDLAAARTAAAALLIAYVEQQSYITRKK